MPDFSKLDLSFRLTPWTEKSHADYIAGRYGSLLENPEAAELYVQGYEKAEKAFDEAYEHQQEMLRSSSRTAGMPEQELPKIEKIEWDPRKRYDVTKKAPKAPRQPKAPKTPKVEKPVKEEKKPKEEKLKEEAK